jgi:hypothetical protein
VYAVWLVCRLTAIVRKSDSAAVVTGARVDGLRLQDVSIPVSLAAVWFVCRLTAIVRESDSAAVVTGARVDGLRLQRVSVPCVRSVVGVSTDGDCV